MVENSEEIDAVARRYATSAVDVLGKLLVSALSEAARVAAACAILDRGYGKPGVATGDEAQPVVRDQIPSTEIATAARRFGCLAIAVLRKIAEHGTAERARVNAARALLDRGFGVVAATKAPPGLKATASAAAESAGVGSDWGTDLLPVDWAAS
jgi:hypothetical protein